MPVASPAARCEGWSAHEDDRLEILGRDDHALRAVLLASCTLRSLGLKGSLGHRENGRSGAIGTAISNATRRARGSDLIDDGGEGTGNAEQTRPRRQIG